ncbi:MAG: glycosyltransferase [Phycisphaerales bacterium]
MYPFWELPEIPRGFRRDLLARDAAWAPSAFVAGALASIGIDAPLIRQPVAIPPESRLVPLCARSEPLSVLTYLDFDSFPARKNVRAAVTAFLRAFPPGHPASLTVKVRGSAGGKDRAWLASQAADDRRIRVIDATLQWNQVEELVRACDVFLSMHRSEGFGFGAAEAMAHAKAVVSTDHGGTTDFVTCATGFPVACSLVPVRRGEYPAWRGQRWAEPSIDHATELLRSIDVDRASAAERGRLGRAWMEEHHSPAAVGRTIRAWLTARGWLGQETAS